MATSTSTETESKYRPAFTKQEILYLLDLCNKDKRSTTTELAFTIASRLRIFALKADLGIISPSHTAVPKVSLEEKLGMESASPLEKRKAAYEFCKENPGIATPVQERMAATYRYENGLMTPTEEAEYESQ